MTERERFDFSLNVPDVEREELEVDVLLIGAGPATLSCAIHLQRLLKARGIEDKTLLVLEKAEEIGHHTMSGAVMNPRGMQELFGDWRDLGCPVESDVTDDAVIMLRENGKHRRFGGLFVPPPLKNHGNVIVSMNRVVRWLQEQAEGLGVEIYAGFAASSVLYDDKRVVGVQTRDGGLAKDGTQKANFEPGMNVKAPVTVFGEGPRGSLAKGLIRHLHLDAGRNPQTYGTGIKEIWEVPEARGREWLGRVLHTAGHPIGGDAYGGGWIYGLPDNRLSLGFVIGLDHHDARLDPHALFVQWKQHPFMTELLEGGKIERYGAKTVPEGGYFSMPKMQGDGFVLVGDTAGFMNASSLKGVHLAIKSGMLAAEAICEALVAEDTGEQKLAAYTDLFEDSWARDELYRVRNYRQAFEKGMLSGILDFGVQMVTGGRGLVKRRAGHADHVSMSSLDQSTMEKPVFDDKLSLDKLTDVYHSGAIHEEDQPSHLLVLDTDICVSRCTEEYGNPCQHFCPAAVYEWPSGEAAGDGAAEGPAGSNGPVINASNCVHCKTCDIADPYENIEWVVPEGSGGPKYIGM